MSQLVTTPALRDEIIERCWQGETFSQIASDIGLGAHRIGQIAREAGFPTKDEMLRLQGDAICALFELHESVTEVARRLAVSPQTVRNVLLLRGIQLIRSRQHAS